MVECSVVGSQQKEIAFAPFRVPKLRGDDQCRTACVVVPAFSIGLICLGAQATAEAKTAQECYKEDSNWTVSCGALEGPQKLRDDCFSAADRRLERCLDAASTGKIDPGIPAPQRIPPTLQKPSGPISQIERAPQ